MAKGWKRVCGHVALGALLLSACQPTPKTEPVVIKAEEYLAHTPQPQASATPAPYPAPDRVEYQGEDRGLSLTIDAPVILPEGARYMVVQVKKAALDEEFYGDAMAFFFPDGQWVREPRETKRDILERMAALTPLAETDPNVAAELAALQQRLAQAPEDSEAVPFSLAEAEPDAYFTAYHYDRDTAQYAVFTGKLDGNTFQFRRRDQGFWVRESGAETDGEREDFAACDPAMDPQAALSIATEAMEALGADPQMQLALQEKALFYENGAAAARGWIFFFTRNCYGLQASYRDSWRLFRDSKPSHAAPWKNEYMVIVVDDTGAIAQYDSRGAGEQDEILRQDATLLPFDEILGRIQQQLIYHHAYQSDAVAECAVYVYQIRLASALINVRDRQDVGHMVPAWEILYEFRERRKGESTPVSFDCCLYLNALDGSYIEPKAYINRIAP